VDGHDAEALDAALTLARATKKKPTLICCRTVIGYGAPNKSNTHDSHGAPLGPEEARATKVMLGWDMEPFSVPDDIREEWDARPRGAADEAAWNDLFARYRAAYPELAAEFERRMAGDLPESWPAGVAGIIRDMAGIGKPLATRQASGEALHSLAALLPELFGGSADLSASTHALHKLAVEIKRDSWEGNYLHYGVREFLMACVMNGLALHGGFIPYGGTFLVFADYMWPALRLGAMMRVRAIHVLSHDSIGVGEDGPTHQPVEQAPALRLIPGLDVWRPADAVETAVAWKCAVERRGPSALVLSRQSLPQQRHEADQAPDIERGGYILRDCEGVPEAIVIATGSEVQLGLAAVERLQAAGRRVRLVSMPCMERFEEQDAAWRESVLPATIRRRVAVEAAACDGWHKYVGLDGRIVGMRGFGASAPGAELFTYFGITTDAVVKAVEECLA
jgi:transketolase